MIYCDVYGYIKGYLRSDGFWWISEFVIRAKYRGHGRARVLAKHLPKQCMLYPMPMWGMHTASHTILPLQSLLKFYLSLGFVEEETDGQLLLVRYDV